MEKLDGWDHATHHLASSDCEPLRLAELLALADATETSAALLAVGSELWFGSLSAVAQARGAVRCEVCPAGHFARRHSIFDSSYVI